MENYGISPLRIETMRSPSVPWYFATAMISKSAGPIKKEIQRRENKPRTFRGIDVESEGALRFFPGTCSFREADVKSVDDVVGCESGTRVGEEGEEGSF